jgi:hypothetical protein
LDTVPAGSALAASAAAAKSGRSVPCCGGVCASGNASSGVTRPACAALAAAGSTSDGSGGFDRARSACS